MSPCSCAPQRRKKGFTLIELSIVLVVIALLIGGVLVGRDMIHAANIRNTGSMLDKVDTATNTFRIKYNCLPGDCRNATSFGFTAGGNGDGAISSIWGTHHENSGTENYQFFQQLITANLIHDDRYCTKYLNDYVGYNTCEEGPYTITVGLANPSVPGNALNEVAGAFVLVDTSRMPVYLTTAKPVTFKHAYSLAGDLITPLVTVSPATTMKLDRKFDDGLPFSGNILALGPRWWGTTTRQRLVDDQYFIPSYSCMDRTTTPWSYLNSTSLGCLLIWRAKF